MRGIIRYAELDQGRGRDHRADDVGRGDGDGEADDPDDQRCVDRRQQQAAAGIGDHNRRKLQAEASECHDADDDADRGFDILYMFQTLFLKKFPDNSGNFYKEDADFWFFPNILIV